MTDGTERDNEGSQSRDLPPIFVADLFPEISSRLIALLQSLSLDEWHLPTSSSRRSVKDVATHLLDGSLRRLSFQRDRYVAPDGSCQPRTDETLLAFLDRLNAEWEIATRRLSPKVLVEFMEWADTRLATLFASLDPFGPAIFPVAWAGQTESPNWLDVARDYTEKWHHTQQIFEATGRPSTITERYLFHPCLDTFMRALPYTFRNAKAPAETTVVVHLTGAAGGTWMLERGSEFWRLVTSSPTSPASTVKLDPITLWHLVTKRRSREEVLARFPSIQIDGDFRLGGHFLDMVSMMA